MSYIDNYWAGRGLVKGEELLTCEYCKRSVAVDIHHINEKKIGGGKKDNSYSNLIALCRACHEGAHSGKVEKVRLEQIAQERE